MFCRYGFNRLSNVNQNQDFVSDFVQAETSLNGTLNSCKALEDFSDMADGEYCK